MTYHTNIRHQELVALLGTRNLYLRLVYAHIANYTQVKGAWCGTKQKLAEELEMERSVVSRKLEELINRGLVLVEKDNYRAVCTEERAESTEERAESTQNRAESTKILPSIINNNKEMKRNEKYARDTIATPNPTDLYSFERLENLYHKRAGAFKIDDEIKRQCRAIWDNYPLWKRMLLFEELTSPTGWCKPRLDWTLSDFNPQPDFMSGQEQDAYWKTETWTERHEPLVLVKTPENLFKVCTSKTMFKFGLAYVRDVKEPRD